MAAWKGAMANEKMGLPVSGKRVALHAQKQANTKRTIVVSPFAATVEEDIDVDVDEEVDVDLSEVYFLIMHFLSSGPCNRATGQLWNELLQHKLLPRRYHARYSRTGLPSGDEDDDGASFPLSYIQVVKRNPDIEKDHLVKLLRQQLIASRRAAAARELANSRIPTAADVPTVLGLGSFSLLETERLKRKEQMSQLMVQLRWPHSQSNQVHGLGLREIGGGFARHHRSPAIRAASYALVKPSVLVDRIQTIKTFRGHRNVVYCAIFDRTGQHIITGSDDRLVKIWSTETGFCLRSCRGHEGDITELSVSSGNALVASASNDCTIRVWRSPDGIPISVLRGHTGAVTAISFSPRQSCEHHLLSSSDDGTCRIWDARDSSVKSRVYMPKLEVYNTAAKSGVPMQPVQQPVVQISCCAFNADGSIFVTGSSDKFARVWDARKWNDELTGKPNHELDVLKGHENAVNYVQFSGCAGLIKPLMVDTAKEERSAKFKNSWSARDSIVTCSRDGSAIIWIHKSRKKEARYGRWTKAYHLRVPPPPMPPQPPRGGGPRQRLLPTPRGVNMIVWSLDNRFVLAAIMDCRICVWNAVDGSLVHSLTGHTKSTFVVDVHPFNPRIAMSAGYDGRVIIWDIWEGCPVRVYETGDFQIVDGCFSPDGTTIVVSDEVGQIYLLGTGKGESQKDAKYDQFFLGDFRPLVRDIHGNVLDQETQLPPHQRNIQDLLCDANMIPYQEPYQSMYQQRRLGALGIDWQPPTVNFAVGIDDVSYVAYGDHLIAHRQAFQGTSGDTIEGGTSRWVEQPTDADDALDWEVDVNRHSDDSGSEYSASEESLSLLDDEGTASSSEGIAHSDKDESDFREESDSKEESNQATLLRRSNRQKRIADGLSSDLLGRELRRHPLVLQEPDEEVPDHRCTRQRQAHRDSSVRWEFKQSARPKRVAAQNALQVFSHINTKKNEDEDETSSSQQDTSSFSMEKEPESDGPPMSVSFSSKEKEVGSQVKEDKQEEILARVAIAEVPQDKIEDCESEEKEISETREGVSEKNLEDAKQEMPPSTDEDQKPDADEDDTDGDSEFDAKDELSEKAMSTGVDLSDQGDFSRRPRSQRRLVLKLQNNKTTCFRQENRAFAQDAHFAYEHLSPKEIQDSSSREHGQRKLRRLVPKHPQATTGFYDTFPGSSDTNDNGCGSGELPLLDSRNIRLPRERRRLSRRGKRKLKAGMMPNAKRTKGGHALSDSNERSGYSNEACQDGPHKDVKLVSPEEDLNFVEEVNSEGERNLCGVGSSISPPEHFDPSERDDRNSSKRLLDSRLEREFSLNSSVKYLPKSINLANGPGDQEEGSLDTDRLPGVLTHNEIESHSQVRKIGFRWRETFDGYQNTSETSADVRKDTEAQLFRYTDRDHSAAANVDNHTARIMKGRRSSLHHSGKVNQHDDLNFLQMIDKGSKSAINSLRRVRITNNVERVEACENMEENAQNSSAKIFPKAEQKDISIGNSDSDHSQEDESWSESQSGEEMENEDAHDFRHKRTPLGELDSSNDMPQNSSDDFMGKRRVRHMRSVMSDGLREMRSKRSREKKLAVHNGKEASEKTNGRRHRTWAETRPWHESQDEQNQADDLAARLGTETDAVQRSGQDEACVPFERKVLRMSNRTRREVARRERGMDRDERRQAEMPLIMKDRGVRTRRSSAWLLLSDVEEGTRYIPQFGDFVVYLRQGHEEFMDSLKLSEPGPWMELRALLRDVEVCQVVELDYAILPDSGDTCCKLTLEFRDYNSELCGQTFKLTLPELTNFPDFLVEKNRYDASIARNWTNRDRCKVWWRSLDGGGEWWEGRVIAVKPKSSDFPHSPWERLTVQYKTDTSKPLRHSPWELFDPTDGKWEPPCIDEHRRNQSVAMLECAACEADDAYGLRRLKQAAAKSDFINRLPLPLTLDVVKQRLDKKYYRSVRAFCFDVQLLASNAEKYFGTASPVANKVQNFCRDVLDEIAACKSPP